MTPKVNARELAELYEHACRVLCIDGSQFAGTISLQCLPGRLPKPDVRHFPEVVDGPDETGVR